MMRSLPSTRYPPSSFLNSDSITAQSDSAALSPTTEPTEIGGGGGGFIHPAYSGNVTESSKSGTLALSRAASPTDVFSAPGVQLSSRLLPTFSLKSPVFGSIDEAPIFRSSSTLPALVDYGDDTDDLGDAVVTPPGRVNSPTAFGTVPNAFLPAATPSKSPDAIRRSTSLSTLSGGDADSPQLVYPALEDSPSFSEARSAPLTAATESSSTSLPKRKLSTLSSLPSPSKRSRLADYLHATPGLSSVVINGVTYIPTEDITRLTASSMVINGVPYVPTGNITRSTRSPTGDTSIPFAVRGPSPPPTLASTSGKLRYTANPDEIEFITPPQSSRSLPVPSDIDMYDALDLELPDDLDSIPALSPLLSHARSPSKMSPFPLQFGAPALLSSPRSGRCLSPTKPVAPPTTPVKDLPIQKALAAVQNISPARSPLPTRPVPGPSPAPQRRSLLSQIDSIVSAPATSSALVQSPPPALFDDGGLSDDGCLRLELFDAFLAPTYVNVLNLRMPVLYPIVANTPLAEDADWLPFREVYSPLDLAQKRSVFRCTIFTNLGCFVNPSRANPAVVQRMSSAKGTTSLCPSGNGRLARHTSLFLTTGVVKRSSLYSVIPVPQANSNIRVVREILLRPFQQEFQCLAGFFASAFSFDSVAFPASAGCMSLTSTQYFEDQRSKVNDDYSPIGTIQQPNRPPRYVETDHRLTVMVPVYDGRCTGTNTAFECEHNQLHELAIASYPLYGTGMVNLPPGSTVTVGYTAHTYSTQRHYRNIPTCVSLNVAFVILLALPGAAARLACSPLAVAPLPLTLNTLAPAYPVESPFASSSRSTAGVTSHINSIDEVVYYEDLF
ncbi:hypothetical protein BDP27DRAFT_1451916 [Rhodocollybia butyracea]|uniref:Uncharacterized protein n=1 Tax=Rhodocollybia butyracea TaxID=206335 RepID=A0A9P5U1X0_9AGAR|nr:hypothetical protein BDP27DRAFT_1451916 [Rhodocollybia butyracea]